jgi:hypothetical protein
MTEDILSRPQKPSFCEKENVYSRAGVAKLFEGRCSKLSIDFEKLISLANGNFEEQKRSRSHPKLLLIISLLLLLLLLIQIIVIIV